MRVLLTELLKFGIKRSKEIILSKGGTTSKVTYVDTDRDGLHKLPVNTKKETRTPKYYLPTKHN